MWRKIKIVVVLTVGASLICLFATWHVFVGLLMVLWAREQITFSHTREQGK